ncbi:hypothetical protein ACQUQU_15170 [Thalassolituus sp. LLYu03]|uniref:hypothetical protein n=1 Tax=Thalassolituus sp. LLYu03 TaxID=3421656 RepID=UPI003D2E50BF
MKNILLASALLALIPAANAGIKTTCTHGQETRIIEVVYSGESTVPCEVQYTKSEGTSVLWSAQNMTGYCEQKAEEFVTRQKDWGWDCATEMSAIDSAESSTDAAADESMTAEAPATEAAAPATSAASE